MAVLTTLRPADTLILPPHNNNNNNNNNKYSVYYQAVNRILLHSIHSYKFKNAQYQNYTNEAIHTYT